VRRWVEAAINGQLKSMKTSLRLSADQEKLWDPFESAVKDGENASPCKGSKAITVADGPLD
jgi:hypothetical protein